MPLSSQRLARNQVIFREVNERLRALADAVPDGKTDYLCECSDVECTDKIELRLLEYESVRARPKTFFIISGHERLEVERIVDQTRRLHDRREDRSARRDGHAGAHLDRREVVSW